MTQSQKYSQKVELIAMEFTAMLLISHALCR